MKSYKIAIIILTVIVLSIMSLGLNFDSRMLKDATDNSFMWYVPTTASDTSEILDLSKLKNPVIDWKVTNGGNPIVLSLKYYESLNGIDWAIVDSTPSITSTAYGLQKLARRGGRYGIIIAEGYRGNGNDTLVIGFFNQE